MAEADSTTEEHQGTEPPQADDESDLVNEIDNEIDLGRMKRTLKVENGGNGIGNEEDDDDSSMDVTDRLGEFPLQDNCKTNGFGAMSGAKDGERQMFVHSFSVSTSSWRSWSSRVAATTNIGIVIKNISLLHALCSVLLIFMGILGAVAKSYMSYLVLTIWSPIFVFFPTSFTGLSTSIRLRSSSLIQRLIVLSTLSTLLSCGLCMVFAFFIFRDGQLDTDCRPSPAILSSECRQSVYRVLINAVIVFLFVIELIASGSSLLICVIVKTGYTKTPSDRQQLISRTSRPMSYKRLAAQDERTVDYFEDRADSLVNNNSSNMYQRSVSAPALVSLSTTQTCKS
ncbi:uncharacterized protein LOC121425859 [Lytechinus variegatus]|uniref:uncharacterized protein LOC121425859 n=1 Tax=Lytechinus variegatus TaxID=7654 RepID=UPI001BB1D6A1|nr:uncharacterized protein LOC121425859 [Lytechinus variegatus]